MSWLWTLPAILTMALIGVFYPVFTRRGNLPLPLGLEGDPRGDLSAQRDGILLQLKEMELETTHPDTETLTIRTQLEAELAQILTRLDTLGPLPIPNSATSEGGRNPLDISIGFTIMLLIGLLSSGLYLMMGTTEEIEPATAQQVLPDEFIAMVEQSAIKLQATPDDLAGWGRLARSYTVLNQPDKAMAAYAHILSRKPDEIDAAVGLSELQMQSDNAQLHAEAITRFEAILAQDPNRPEPLWFLGGAALRDGHREKALQLWQRLKPLLTPGSAAFKTVEQAIEQVEKQ